MPSRLRLPYELEVLADQQLGVLSRSQLRAHGVSRYFVEHRLGRREWQQPLPGAYVLHAGVLSWRQRCWAALAWSDHAAALSGPTAAQWNGLKGYESRDILHLHVPHEKCLTSPTPRLIVHRSRRLAAADLYPGARPNRISTPLSIVQTAALRRDAMDSVAVLAAGVQQQLVSATQLIAAVEHHWQLRHKAELRDCLLDIKGGAHSLPEREFLVACRKARLPAPVMQEPRYFQGRKRYLDAYFARWRVVAEIDGMFHMQTAQWWDDIERGNEVGIEGNLLLRFPASRVRLQPQRVTDTVARALRAQGWDGRAS